MDISTSLINEIHTKKTYHRFLELDLSKDEKQQLLKKALVDESLQLFATRKARDLLTKLLSKLKSYSITPYGKVLVNTLLPTQDINVIAQRQQLCHEATQLTIEYEEFSKLLLQATTLSYDSTKKHNGTCIAFSDEELYMELRSSLSKKYYVTLIENEQDFVSIDHYEHIRFIATTQTSLIRTAQVMSQVTIIRSSELLDIAPEFVTDILTDYQEAINALSQLTTLLPLSFSLPSVQFEVKRQSFVYVQEQMTVLFQAFEQELSHAISQAQFSGQQLMKLVNQQQSVLDYLPLPVSEQLAVKKHQLQKDLETLTGISCLELFSLSKLGEFVLDDKRLKEIEMEYHAGQEESLYERKVKIAKEWDETLKQLPVYVEELYHYDLKIALREFIKEYELSKPTLVDQGISFVYGKNMNIKDATPIEYHIGVDDKVAIITGANSGGKTTLLELLGQIQILTHMGLYVPAKEAQVGLVDEMYYFSKNKGSMSAGAFETLLKQFSSISDDASRKLILADEIESVTEPDVAAKIIKGIINHLLTSPSNILVLVTHMGRELQELEVQGRFDGIEAKGLDKDLNLVVDRNPVIGRIARSTPQLIIERLSQLHKTPFYSELKKLVT